MSMPQTEIFFEPGNNLSGLNTFPEKPFLFGQDSKVLGRFSGFGLDVIEIGFQCYFVLLSFSSRIIFQKELC
jgi:hypothetical protein